MLLVPSWEDLGLDERGAMYCCTDDAMTPDKSGRAGLYNNRQAALPAPGLQFTRFARDDGRRVRCRRLVGRCVVLPRRTKSGWTSLWPADVRE